MNKDFERLYPVDATFKPGLGHELPDFVGDTRRKVDHIFTPLYKPTSGFVSLRESLEE